MEFVMNYLCCCFKKPPPVASPRPIKVEIKKVEDKYLDSDDPIKAIMQSDEI